MSKTNSFGKDGITNTAFYNDSDSSNCGNDDNYKTNNDKDKNGLSVDGKGDPKLDGSISESFEIIGLSDKKGDQNDDTIPYVPGDSNDPYKAYRWSKQIVLIVVWICVGLAGEIVGPTMPDLIDKVGGNYATFSRVLSSKSIGLMTGAVVGGFIHEKFYKKTDLIIAIGLFLQASATLLTPFSTSLVVAGVAFALNGFGEGIVNTGGNTMVMHLWMDQATSHMHALHFGFGLGAITAPQIARPFLSQENDTESSNFTTNEPIIITEARIEIPYAIIASIITLVAIIMIGFFVKGHPSGFPIRRNTKSFKTMASPGSCTGGNVIYGIQLFICLFLYCGQAIGGGRTYAKFLFSYATERNPPFSNNEASNLQSVYWFSFTTGRFLGTLIAKVLHVRWIIVCDVIGNMITAIVLSVLAEENDTVLWVCTAFAGLFVSIAFPNGMSWSNLYLSMNSVGVMVLMVGGSFGGFIYQNITGTLFEKDPHNMMYVMILYSGMLGISFLLMEGFARFGSGQSTCCNSNTYDLDY